MKFTLVILSITAPFTLAWSCGDTEYSIHRLLQVKKQSERLVRDGMKIDGFPQRFDDTDGLKIEDDVEEEKGSHTKPPPGGYLQFPLTLQPFKGGDPGPDRAILTATGKFIAYVTKSSLPLEQSEKEWELCGDN